MKLLWVSNGPALNTGYGRQTATFLPRIRKAGHEVTLFALGGHDGAPGRTNDGTPTLPRLFDANGNDVVLEHMKNARAEVAITLGNASAFDPEKYRQIPWCAWPPVNNLRPIEPDLRSLQRARWIWAMSRFNERLLREAGLEVEYVPHGIDRVFHPRDREQSRLRLSALLGSNIGDRFLVVMVAKNGPPPRKGFLEAFGAFALLGDKDARLVVFSLATEALGGENLRQIAERVGLGTERVLFPSEYQMLCGMIGPEDLASAYSAADVFLSGSHGESFGLPALEAEICGCPAVLPDNTAQNELCLGGFLARTEPYVSASGAWARPGVRSLADGLAWAKEKRGDQALRAKARELALTYDADRVFQTFMAPALGRMDRGSWAAA